MLVLIGFPVLVCRKTLYELASLKYRYSVSDYMSGIQWRTDDIYTRRFCTAVVDF